MPKKMHEKQIENLLAQSSKERYEYFVRYCADFEQVWGLKVGGDSWVIFKDNEGDQIFPLWPHEDLARACCFKEHQELDAKPTPIQMEPFLNYCVEDMINEKVYFGIFYDLDRTGIAIDGASLKNDLLDEINTVWE